MCTVAGCATPEAAAACDRVADGEACITAAIVTGTCVGGRCQSVACGNGLEESAEICDDGNLVAGDGCSAACDSLETCGNGLVDPATDEECDDGIAGRSGDGCSSRCFVEPEVWREVVVASLSPRTRAAAAFFDVPPVSHTVVFGGMGDAGYLGDTWIRDNGSKGDWHLHEPTVAPSPRAGAAITFDETRERVVLFGGFGPGGALADTWEWDGAAWIARTPATAPPARGDASAAFDSTRNRVVLFGGRATGDLDDTWEWDGTSWLPVTTATTPAPRSRHTMAYDGANVVLYGGSAPETWTYNGTDWTAAAAGPVEPVGSRLVYDREYSQLTLLGRAGSDMSVYQWSGTAWIFVTSGELPPRTDPCVVSDGTLGQLIVMLGMSPDETVLYDDVWQLDGDSWSTGDQAAQRTPDARVDHAMAFDGDRGEGVLFGGRGTSETWVWSANAWSLVDDPSVPRYAHTIVYDLARQRMIAYGGYGDNAVLSADTLAWDGSTWNVLAPLVSPPARADHAMAYDAGRARVVMFGGRDPAIPRGDTWEWDGTTWTARTLAPSPSARHSHAIAYDASRARVVLFGGADGNGIPLGDTWEYDGTTWVDRTTATGPSSRFDHAMGYDPLRERVLLIGGDLFEPDTWEWDGTAWERRTPASEPPDRLGGALFYDTIGRQMVLFGGQGARFLRETYVRSFELAGQYERCQSATEDGDGDGLAGCSDPDCAGRCARCGDSACDPVEDSRLCPGDCP